MKNLNLGFLIQWMPILLFLNGCTLFFGNVKPLEEKSKHYEILDLSQGNSEWIRLDQKTAFEPKDNKDSNESSDLEISDKAYQSKITSAIISINSSCKMNSTANSEEKENLEQLTDTLLLGINNIVKKDSKFISIVQIPALETTVQGKLNHDNTMLRAIVFHHSRCTYDLLYITRAERFNENLSDFSTFVSSFKLK